MSDNNDINPKLAKQFYRWLSDGEGSIFFLSKYRKFYADNNKSKSDCFVAVAKMFGEPKTNDQIYMVSQCYVKAGAAYRYQAITYLEKFIAVGAVWSGTQRAKINMGDHVEDQLLASIASIWYQLGKAYEGEYEFEKARQAYLKAFEIDRYYTPAVCGVANTYVKMNDLSGGIKYLAQFSKSDYKDLKLIAREEAKKIREKKAAGYVYKPRKKKSNGN
ncbi:MAG: hypothetical protein IJ723_00215 [Ruminococcus sp.]|nr:hypothetical protein [Ruminococcus sp.]